jgi:hypothetical protein
MMESELKTAFEPRARATKRQAQRDPLVRSGLVFPEPQLTLETTKGKGRATGTIGVARQHISGETTFGLSVSSPIGEAPDAEARPLDLRGLSDGASVGFTIGGSSYLKAFSASDVRTFCIVHKIATADCTAGKLEDENNALSKQLLGLVFRKVPILYSGSFTYGRNKFSFVDAAGAKQPPERHNDLQAEGSVGLLVNQRRDLLGFHIAYSRAFKAAADKTQICRPLSGSTASRCDVATIGGPTEDRAAISTIEYRWQMRGDAKVPVAFAPKLQFAIGLDGADNVTSIEAPFYFFQEKPDPKAASSAPKLNGGITSGWRSDSGFQAAVFIGTTFRLFEL